MGARPSCNSAWLQKLDSGEKFLPCIKLKAAAEQIHEWRITASREKILVFFEWNQFAVMLGRALEIDKVQFLYYTVG